MPEGVRLQNLRDFTVQIRNAADQIVGTGIAVSMDGKIVTCRHVVEAAIKSQAVDGAEVRVYFPQARGGEEKKRKACVEKYFPQHDDDVVLLQLTDGPSPLAPEQIAVLGMAGYSEGNPFRTYGYSPIGDYPASRADGIILGSIETPPGRNLQLDPVQLQSRQIAAGMSGAAVLDVERNLVVGLVAERYYPESAVQDDLAYGVDGQVLTFDPFSFLLRDEKLELRAAPEPKFDRMQAESAVFLKEKYVWNNAPTVLPEWTGRDELLKELTKDWNDPQKHVAGLIGFGGEGKSSLARKWVETILTGDSLPLISQKLGEGPGMGVDGLFWWGFYENRSVDEFLEAALNYLSGGRIDPTKVQSSSLRAQIIGAMLGAGKYLFVLDGLEVLQHQEGDQYGLLQSNDLRDLLTYFARLDNQSFCLITSRAPLLDLMEYTTYSHYDVDRLSEAEGVALLEKLGVKGSKEQMRKVVSDWDGHALTVSLLGSYLAEKHGGDLAHLAELPVPTTDEPRYERVHRVLRRYDEHLNKLEREFLKLFSAFRTPVHEDSFDRVFVPLLHFNAENVETAEQTPITKSPNHQIAQLVSRLVTYRIIKHDPATETYTAHSLVRNHYLALLMHGTSISDTVKDAHLKIKDYYLSIAGDTPQYPTLEDLKPLIEVVHHACQAGAYDEADQIYDERICQKDRFVLMYQLGVYEIELELKYEFFPNKDLTQEPLVSKLDRKRWILSQIGLCLSGLGRLRDAMEFYERKNKIALDMEDWRNAVAGYFSIANLYALLGKLEQSIEPATKALILAYKTNDKDYVYTSFSYLAWLAHLQGNIEQANEGFLQLEILNKEIEPDKKYNYRLVGIWHADHLRRTSMLPGSSQNADYAFRITYANLEFSERNHSIRTVCLCQRVLGDLDFVAENNVSAQAHYETALKISRGISARDVLIEVLLARGRFYARTSSVSNTSEASIAQAFNDLNEALSYAVEGGYRIYEADIRVALAWAWLGAPIPGPFPIQQSAQDRRRGSLAKAKAEAERALQMSKEMGYYWGKLDAEEVLGEIGKKIKDEG